MSETEGGFWTRYALMARDLVPTGKVAAGFPFQASVAPIRECVATSFLPGLKISVPSG